MPPPPPVLAVLLVTCDEAPVNVTVLVAAAPAIAFVMYPAPPFVVAVFVVTVTSVSVMALPSACHPPPLPVAVFDLSVLDVTWHVAFPGAMVVFWLAQFLAPLSGVRCETAATPVVSTSVDAGGGVEGGPNCR